MIAIRPHKPAAAGITIALLLQGLSVRAKAQETADVQTVVVTATRQEQLVRDEPIRVEVVPQDEIEENLTVQPGNLSTLLNELHCMRSARHYALPAP